MRRRDVKGTDRGVDGGPAPRPLRCKENRVPSKELCRLSTVTMYPRDEPSPGFKSGASSPGAPLIFSWHAGHGTDQRGPGFLPHRNRSTPWPPPAAPTGKAIRSSHSSRAQSRSIPPQVRPKGRTSTRSTARPATASASRWSAKEDKSRAVMRFPRASTSRSDPKRSRPFRSRHPHSRH